MQIEVITFLCQILTNFALLLNINLKLNKPLFALAFQIFFLMTSTAVNRIGLSCLRFLMSPIGYTQQWTTRWLVKYRDPKVKKSLQNLKNLHCAVVKESLYRQE